jgi:hypothetical protein
VGPGHDANKARAMFLLLGALWVWIVVTGLYLFFRLIKWAVGG